MKTDKKDHNVSIFWAIAFYAYATFFTLIIPFITTINFISGQYKDISSGLNTIIIVMTIFWAIFWIKMIIYFIKE